MRWFNSAYVPHALMTQKHETSGASHLLDNICSMVMMNQLRFHDL